MEFQIEQGIPIPGMGRPRKYPFDKLKVGESFWVPGNDVVPSVRAAAYAASKRLGFKLRCARPKEGGVRVWRIS